MDRALDGLWQQVLDELQNQLSRPTFETWIKPARPHDLSGQTLVISTPNPFARNWLQKHYLGTIGSVVKEILGQAVEVQFVVDAQDVGNGHQAEGTAAADLTWPIPAPSPSAEEATNGNGREVGLNPKAVFSRFVVGANNRMAHAAALAVAEAPG